MNETDRDLALPGVGHDLALPGVGRALARLDVGHVLALPDVGRARLPAVGVIVVVAVVLFLIQARVHLLQSVIIGEETIVVDVIVMTVHTHLCFPTMVRCHLVLATGALMLQQLAFLLVELVLW